MGAFSGMAVFLMHMRDRRGVFVVVSSAFLVIWMEMAVEDTNSTAADSLAIPNLGHPESSQKTNENIEKLILRKLMKNLLKI
ncbi:hypothetical protein CHS0354_040699 [Potamilus streckersoni]|uniref:Uncharacterized protein n=1 Tax=Potamilus streckersoni TaxID=2493646 RepID=A0AAE0SM46_9BIVA|nr:hypothetical protein CHS0354_040699 [Potamilus streckersoni]